MSAFEAKQTWSIAAQISASDTKQTPLTSVDAPKSRTYTSER
jgi:hypothetical protein